MAIVPKHFQVFLDLEGKPCCRCASADVSPTMVRVIMTEQPIGRVGQNTIEIDPITLEFHAGVSPEIARWIRGSWEKDFNRRSGMVSTLDARNNQTCFEFFDALITEVTIPAVDSTSKTGDQLRVKILPERITKTERPFDPKDLVKYGPATSPPWNTGQFSLSIAGLERECSQVRTIGSLVTKQGIKKHYTGEDRFPNIEPTKRDESNILLTLPNSFAKGFTDWAANTVANRMPSSKDGSLQYFAPGSKRPLLELKLFGLVPVNTGLSKADPSGTQLARIELTANRIKIGHV